MNEKMMTRCWFCGKNATSVNVEFFHDGCGAISAHAVCDEHAHEGEYCGRIQQNFAIATRSAQHYLSNNARCMWK